VWRVLSGILQVWLLRGGCGNVPGLLDVSRRELAVRLQWPERRDVCGVWVVPRGAVPCWLWGEEPRHMHGVWSVRRWLLQGWVLWGECGHVLGVSVMCCWVVFDRVLWEQQRDLCGLHRLSCRPDPDQLQRQAGCGVRSHHSLLLVW
jgi:hypothetical protein